MLILTVQNIGGADDNARYEYKVYINRERIAEGNVEGHNRADGWAKLVMMIAEQHLADDVPASSTHTERDWQALQEYFEAQSDSLYFIRGRLEDEAPEM